MKNLFTSLFNLSFFSYAKRLALACAFLTISAAAAAHSTHKFTVKVECKPIGAGSVYVAENSNAESGESSLLLKCDGKDGTDDKFCYLFAKPNSGWAFSNWTLSASKGTLDSSNSSPCKYTINVNSNDGGTETATANFKPIISFSSTTWDDADKTRSVEVKESDESQVIYVYKATDFDVKRTGEKSDNIICTLYDGNSAVTDYASVSDATASAQKSYKIKIKAENASNGDNATFNFKSGDNVYATLTVNIQKDETKVTFLPNSKLSYVAKDNGSGVEHDVTQQKEVDLASKYIVLKVDEKSGFRMCRFKIENGNSVKYLYNHSSATTGLEIDYEATNGDVVSLEEIATTYARYRVDIVENGNTKSYYYDNLQHAFDFARDASNSNKIVYVTKSGNVMNLGTPYQIHNGVTLLVPGDDAETCRTGDLVLADFPYTDTGSGAPGTRFNLKKKLTLDDYTKITVEGNICVYAALHSGQPFLGMPADHGMIEMGSGSEISLESGARLFAYGFIKDKNNNHTNSKIVAKSGSYVYETLQVRDWPTGTHAGAYNDYQKKKVFLIGQYYVQNIETTLKLESGATERISGGVEVDEKLFVISQDFITSIPTNGDAVGFIQLGADAVVEKYYDQAKDRLHINISRKENATGRATAQFGSMQLQVIKNLAINSKDFFFPLNMNITVLVDEYVDVVNLYDIAMLAESELVINKEASLTLNGDLIVYDVKLHPHNSSLGATDNIWGFFRTANHFNDQEAAVIVWSKDNTKGNRAITGNAKLDINGDLYTTSTGTLYTTSKYQDNANNNIVGITDESKIGATITSSQGGGKIHFNNTDFENLANLTYQTKYTKESFLGITTKRRTFIPIEITSAKLRNGDGTYVSTLNEATTFTYALDPENPTTGEWKKPDNISWYETKIGDIITFKVPYESTPQEKDATITVYFTGYSDDVTFTPDKDNDNGIKLGEFVYEKVNDEESKLTIPVSYTQTNEHGVRSATFSISTNKVGLTIPDITVTANEDYEPNFSYEGEVNLSKQLCDPNESSTLLDITIANEGDNVASLLNGNEKLEWEVVLSQTEDDFSFSFGVGKNFLSDAKVEFHPNTAGYKEATLFLTATSKFVAEGRDYLVKNCTIPLSGTASFCNNPLNFNPSITQLFEGEENVTLFDNIGNGAAINISYDSEYINLSPEQGTSNSYTITALKPTPQGQSTTITATQAAANGYDAINELTKEVTILSAVTWHGDILYYGSTYTQTDLLTVNPLITDGVLTIAEDNSDAIKNVLTLTPENAPANNFTLVVGENVIQGEQTVKFIFTSEENNLSYEFSSTLSNLRLLTACVGAENYEALNLETKYSTHSDGVITFNSTSSSTSSWAMQFYGVPSKVTFTPRGTNKWQILQGPTAGSVTQNVSSNWTAYPSGQEVTILLEPTTRFIKFEYGASPDPNNNVGTLTGICVHKMQIEAQTSLVYLPVGGEYQKDVEIKHVYADKLSPESSDQKLTCMVSAPEFENGYYKSMLSLSASEAGEYTVTIEENGAETIIQVIAFNYPMGLPINTDEWISSDPDKRHYYHFYVEKSEYVHWWSAENDPYIVFEYTGNKDIEHSMTFAFEGAPSVIKFDYDSEINADEWTIKEYNSTTGQWQNVIGKQTINGVHLEQELRYTTRKVQLIHKSKYVKESKVSNLIIEGYPKAIINPTELLLTNEEMSKSKTFTITAINLANIKLQVDNPNFTLQYQYINQQGQPVFSSQTTDPISLRAQDNIYPDALGVNKMGDIVVKVTWVGTASVHQGLVTITNLDGEEILGTVKLVGSREFIEYTDDNKGNTGIWTGVPDGVAEGRPTESKYTLRGSFDPYTYHQVNVRNAFDENKNALFDYLVIYGETTTTKVGDYTIYEADGSRGSNACTPYYVYMRDNDGDGVGDGKRYIYVQLIENANSSTKGWLIDGDDALVVPDNGAVSVYVTGFCPYATTGSTKDDEGVLYFRGPAGSRVDVYLEDCHIYSRNKSIEGQKHSKNDAEAPEFTYDVVQGSGAVLVFENTIADLNNPPAGTFDVAIHTIGHNILKSNYGAYNNPFGIASNVKIAQVSATVQVRLGERNHYEVAKTVLDFDDKWPTSPTRNDKGEYTSTYRTNGFLSLQKQANHAPSIDLGNANTVVNFRGGRVELQNAEIVSPNYKTTLAISHRTGIMGNIKDFSFPYGLGTDDVGGTVNFYDGTTTVIDLYVDAAYKDFYLIDKNANGEEITRVNNKGKTEYLTTCLRTPANTFIYGGSHCMLRACKYVTSRGGAPTDGAGNFLGLYKYPSAPWPETIDGKTVTHKGGWTEINGGNGRVTIPQDNLPNANYGTESITPNTNSTANDKSDDYLNFWVPKEYDDNVVIEVDKLIRTWLACMTEIQGGLLGVNARVGGDEYIGEDDEIQNLLYCQLDDYIYGVISATNGVTSSGDPNYTYSAPAINPTSPAENPSYETVPLTSVSDYKQHNVISESDYEVTKKVYYVTTAKTDTWMNFTMPFDVEKIWMLEPYSEADIKTKFNEFKAEDDALANEGKLDKKSPNYLSPMERTKMWQAQHNADFAAFFGMAMAIGQHGKDFNDIYNDYYTWAKNYADAGKYTGDYDLRGLYELVHYNGSNFTDSHYFLYKNMGDWTLNEYDEVAVARWEVAPAVGADSILMNKGETYSMLFPYCTGCDVELEEKDGEWQVKMDEETGLPVQLERDYWDYWSGKLLIFESTNGDPDPNTQDDNRPHTIKGSNYIAPSKVDSDTPWIFDGISPTSGIGVLTGNSTFSTMSVEDYEEVRDYIFTYDDTPYVETFLPAEVDISGKLIYETLVPTESFLIAHYHKPVKLITRNGRVVTEGSEDQGNDNSGTTTGGHMPTVGGGHSMFITGFDGGINVAVATPQQVRVISATGTILYSGYVQNSVDIPLPINGIYIVKGETEVQKIFY